MWLIVMLRVLVACLLSSVWLILELTWPSDHVHHLMPLRLSMSLLIVMILLWRPLLSALCAWLRQRRVSIEEAPSPSLDSWIEPTSAPRFDPVHGIYAPISIGNQTYKVVLQPEYWQFLNPALSRDVKESVISVSPINDVAPGKEPSSLVYLQDSLGSTIGLGCRVAEGAGSVLVTAWHVLDDGKLVDLYLAKAHRKTGVPFRVKFEESWEKVYECDHFDVDIVAIRVPDEVWSRLGVGITKVVPPKVNSRITCFGGQAGKPQSSFGRLTPEGLTGLHGASTQAGWSGTPLYSAGGVVAVHTEWHKLGKSNKSTVLWPIHLCKESWGGEYDALTEINSEEMDAREDIHEYFVHGRGKFRVSGREFSRDFYDEDDRGIDTHTLDRVKSRKGDEWYQAVETLDEDDLGPVMQVPREYRKESSVRGNLNFQEASSACLTPSKTSETTNGKPEAVSKKEECPSLSLEDRVLNLEKLAEATLVQQSMLREQVFQVLLNTDGLKGDPKQNLEASCSKPSASEPLKPQKDSQPPVKNLSASTPKSSKDRSSNTMIGPKRKSRKRSRKSRKGKLTGTPAPASPSPL